MLQRTEGPRLHLSRQRSGGEVFVHYTDVEGEGFRSLGEGKRVSYETASSARGIVRRQEAKKVRRVE